MHHPFRRAGWLATLAAAAALALGTSALAQTYPAKPIRLVDGDHEIDCKVDGIAVGLKACFVRKA